ncbi:hypothetical protein Mgra_00001751 [Meloidogyne graminicola]|uniref:Uncharacterized protein n=1 Tax=Meloidogyne graminicola TaxID=189291 RepID=A0A8S9ZZZ8_9BILA|nr:hypothetical protein Mgra_00001751 [Meloidogyne graminicola]
MLLNFRRLLLVKGWGSKQFLHGLITKDIDILNDTNRLIYTFLLNVKGRIFVDMFIWRLTNILEREIEAYALEIDSRKFDIFQKVLNVYKLRRPIIIESLPKHRVCFNSSYNSLKETTLSSSTIINWTPDPRVLNFGYRSLIENNEENLLENYENEYIDHRYKWGIGEGIELTDQIPLAMNGDLLNGISFNKGLRFFLN